MKLIALTIILVGLRLVADEKCAAPPDVCMWNAARAQLLVMGAAQDRFVEAAVEWGKAKNAELADTNTVSADALRKFTAMWIAWQNLLTEQRKAAKMMHDFYVVEMNQ